MNVAERLRERVGDFRPQALLTLGSGLGDLAAEVTDPIIVGFGDVGLPEPTVPGHAGWLVAGRLHGVDVLVQQGRLHLYEGVGAVRVAACVRAAAALGAEVFVVTNACGGLAAGLVPADLVLLADHLNLTGTSPLVGAGEPVFVDMAGAYDATLRARALEAAAEVGQRLTEGVYAGLIGPAFETPAEIAMLRTLGADVVGMSTVAEVIAARALGLRVVGFSLVTNVHRPGGTPAAHGDVLDVGRAAGPALAAVLRAFLPRLAVVQ